MVDHRIRADANVGDVAAPSTSLSPAHASAGECTRDRFPDELSRTRFTANAVLGIAKSVNVAASFHGYRSVHGAAELSSVLTPPSCSVFTVCLDPFEAFKENTAACAEIIRLGTHAEPPAVETCVLGPHSARIHADPLSLYSNGAYVVQQPGGGFKTLSPGSVGIRQSIGVQLFGARLGAAIWCVPRA